MRGRQRCTVPLFPGYLFAAWAEAAAREAAGETHWLDADPARAGAEAERSSREIEDTWAKKIRGFLLGKILTTVAELLDSALGILTPQQNKAAQMRVAGILVRLGWRKERTARSRFWVPADVVTKAVTEVVIE